jgi:uncharacterized protein (TIGR02147 family)
VNKRDFREELVKISPSKFLHYRDYLRELFQKSKELKEDITLAFFAEVLLLPRSNVVAHIIKGRRPLSAKACEKIIKALAPKPVERRYLRRLVAYNNMKDSRTRDESFQSLLALKEQIVSSTIDKREIQYYADWYNVVIGEMARLPDFDSDPSVICKKLVPSIRPEQARKSIELLKELGILGYDESRGEYVRTERDLSTKSEVIYHSIASVHHNMIELSKAATSRFSQGKRDISSIVLCLDDIWLKKFKDMIHQFHQTLLAEEENCKSPKQAFLFNMQLFPVTRSKKPGPDST